MAAPETHTPLEMVLLFQALDPSDPNPPSFAKLSDTLKHSFLLRESGSYDSSRLDPDSLKQLYLRLMKEQARIDVNGVDKAKSDKDELYNPPLRKPSSPLLDSVSDVSRHLNLIPPLLNRLYFRFRNHAIKAIEHEEHNFRRLQRDIQEIARGEWDARLQLEEINSKSDAKGGVTSIHTLLRHDSDTEKSRAEKAQALSKGSLVQGDAVALPSNKKPIASQDLPVVPVGTSVGVQNENPEQEKQSAQETVRLQPQTRVPPEGPPASETLKHLRTPSTTEPQQLPLTQDLKARPQASLPETSIPNLQPRHTPAPSPGYPLPQPEIPRLPYTQPLSQPVGVPSRSPRAQQASPTQDQPSQPPITLPPLAGVLRSSGSPLGPLNNLTDVNSSQQFKPSPALPSPRPVQLPLNQSHVVQLPPPRNYPVQVYPYYDSQQPVYGATYQYNHNHVPPYHHSNQAGIPPYQASVPSAGRVPMYGAPQIYQPTTPSYSQYPAYSHTSPYQQTPVQPQVIRNPVPRFSDPRTPISGASDKRRPPKPSPIVTSTTSTRWKNTDISGSMRSPGSPNRPGPEDISPLSERAPSPSPETMPSQSKPSKSQGSEKAKENLSRGGTSRGRGPRAASTASSTAAGSVQPRTRSQSPLSQGDELGMGNNLAQHHDIKPESAATPAADEDASITETTADEGSRKSTRRRRETLRGLEMTEISRTGTKRKRDPLDAAAGAASPSASNSIDSRPNHVFGSRNFPRTSATIMNDISGHKLASMFAKPITDREAPGYKDLIFRPQDLKSIRSAIVAGSKALVSAADSTGTVSASGENGSPAAQPAGGTPNPKSAGVWTPATTDVVPPKGIVNSAQLEKELMRMFANAVMFNPDPKRGFGPAFRESDVDGTEEDGNEDRGEDRGERKAEEEEGGVVKDTREMYDAVERSVAYWRAAERAVEDSSIGGGGGVGSFKVGPMGRLRGGENEEDGEADELAGEDRQGRDDEDGGGGKRRRR
ncbi:hypothetical protein MMC07_003358 [Pseudocyphellaria aurata]|nr:hypothetical protein [Pseudocyphellaria aurata]